MFVTQKSYQAPYSVDFGGEMRTYWRAAELAVVRIWFIATVGYTRGRKRESGSDQQIDGTTTYLLAEANEVVRFFDNPPDSLTLLAVQAVIPKFTDVSKDWEMSDVAAIWLYQPESEDETGAFPVEVIETGPGNLFPCLPVHRPILREKLTLLAKIAKRDAG